MNVHKAVVKALPDMATTTNVSLMVSLRSWNFWPRPANSKLALFWEPVRGKPGRVQGQQLLSQLATELQIACLTWRWFQTHLCKELEEMFPKTHDA